MSRCLLSLFAAPLAALLLLAGSPATAALFGDDEARRAILDLRQRFEAHREAQTRQAEELRRQTEELRKLNEEVVPLRRSLLDLQSQIDALRSELAQARGRNEELTRALAEVQRQQKDVVAGVQERLQRFEPVRVTVDGVEFDADPAERRDFETALAVFRRADFVAAQGAFEGFVRRWPSSGYLPSALFWLGNAQYANRDYNGALSSFRGLLSRAPDHARAPEAVLAIANCQIELKDTRAARKTLEDLVKAYPSAEAAAVARERLARLR